MKRKKKLSWPDYFRRKHLIEYKPQHRYIGQRPKLTPKDEKALAELEKLKPLALCFNCNRHVRTEGRKCKNCKRPIWELEAAFNEWARGTRPPAKLRTTKQMYADMAKWADITSVRVDIEL